MQGKAEVKKLNLNTQKKMFLMEFQNLEKKGFFKKELIYARELDEAFSSEIVHPEVLKELMEALTKKGISVELQKKKNKKESEQDIFQPERTETEEKTNLSRIHDPVRLYLRKIGSVSLLDRKGEVLVSKSIEKGEKKIMKVILMCPLGAREVIRFKEHLEKHRFKVKNMVRGLDEQDLEKSSEEGFIESINQTVHYAKKYYEKTRESFKVINKSFWRGEEHKKEMQSIESLNEELMKKLSKVNFNRKIINRIITKFRNTLNRIYELEKRD